MRATMALLVEEKMQAGLSPDQARREAQMALGGVEPVKQRIREERSGALVETIVKDTRYALRMLRTNPGFTLVVVLSLAAGIGANSAMFSVANALVWRSLRSPVARTAACAPHPVARAGSAALLVSHRRRPAAGLSRIPMDWRR